MILVVDNDSARLMKMRRTLYEKFALNTCGATDKEAEASLTQYPVAAVFVPFAETLPDLIGFCRRFKLAHPNIPLIATVPKEAPGLDLDLLYGVTDNIPLRPLFLIRQVEIICEMIRLYTRRDRLEQTVAGVTLNIYTPTVFFGGLHSRFSVGSLSILRYLASQSPRPVHVDELARCTGNPVGRHETGGRVRQRISMANQHAIEVFGRPLIANKRGVGYFIDPYATK